LSLNNNDYEKMGIVLCDRKKLIHLKNIELEAKKNQANKNTNECGKNEKLQIELRLSIEKQTTTEFLSDDDLKKLQIFKLLYVKKTSTNDSLDTEFSTIALDDIQTNTINNALNSIDFVAYLKPYIFNLLKSLNRLAPIKNHILKFVKSKDCDKKWNFLSKIEERDLICSIIQSLNSQSKPKFGTLLAKNDYPLPFMFTIYEENDGYKQKIEFEIFNDLLGLTNKSLMVISGTKNTVGKGKSSLIPVLLSGLHEERSIFKSKTCYSIKKNNVDLIYNSEYWVIADFHSEIETQDAKNLLKAFSAYSTLHVINATIDDFDANGDFKCELNDFFKWYYVFQKSSAVKPAHVVIVIRDCENYQLEEFGLNQRHEDVLAVEDISEKCDKDSIAFNKKALIDDISPIMAKLNKKPMHSIVHIKNFFENLCKDASYNKNIVKKFDLEVEFHNLFQDYDLNLLENIFPIANKNAQIQEVEDNLNKIGYYNPNRDSFDVKLHELKQELKHVEPITKYLKFFIKMILDDDNFISNTIMFENFLIDLKKDKIEHLRKERLKNQDEHEKLIQNIKKIELNFDNMSEKSIIINELSNLKQQRQEMESRLKMIDSRIDVFDLTVDKFWDEIFSINDWIISREKQNFTYHETDSQDDIEYFKIKIPILIDRYTKLVEYGFPIHILRGRPLKIEGQALEMVFGRLKSNEELFIITVIGEQSSAKSSLLNSLFGCDFRTSAGRCTVGIYMNFVKYNNKKIVILDTEGLMSVESGNTLFDNQLATMAVLSSHMIIVNHKGEISSNLERLLGITFYAKLQTSTSIFKPSVMFVLRDQTGREKSSVATQAAKLKNKLVQQTSKIKQSIDDVMYIDTNDIILLPNAFSEDKDNVTNREIKWSNNLFPDKIFELRKLILLKLENMNKTGHMFDSLTGLYVSMCSYWKTLEDLGFGILNCKDLEEIKMRNEISTKCSILISQYDDRFYKNCQAMVQKAQRDLENSYTDGIFNDTISMIDELYKDNLGKIFSEYEQLTCLSYFPEEIKQEYRLRIEQSLDRVKCICVVTFKNYSSYVKQTRKLENVQNEMIKIASDLVKSAGIGENFDNLLINKMNLFDSTYDEYLSKLYDADESFIKKIQNCFNQNHGQFIFVEKYKHFEITPKIEDLDELINGFVEVNTENWFKHSLIDTIKSYLTFDVVQKDQLLKWIEDTIEKNIIPQAISQITKPFVEDAHIRNVYEIINNNLFNIHSPVSKRREHLYINRLTIDVFKLTFERMYLNYIKLKKTELSTNRYEYETMKIELIKNIKEDIENMESSKTSGERTAEQLISIIENILNRESKTSTEISISVQLMETLKNPEQLIEHAFQTSFLANDYEKVLKYVVNIGEYCEEVSQSLTEYKIKPIIATEINNFQRKLNELVKFFGNFDLNVSGNTVHGFLNSIIESVVESEIQNILNRTKIQMIDLEIKNIDHFKTSFKDTVCKKVSESINNMQINIDSVKNVAQVYSKEILNKFIGCVSVCPGCGSKCHLQPGHVGSHRSNKHILNGFNGWHFVDSNVIVTEYCWEENFYLKSKIQAADKIYDNFESYLKECHPDWLADIKHNNVVYSGGTINSKTFINFNYFMKKSWMNVRHAIIARHNLVDRKYENDWLILEDKEKML
jgi:hypothetical protein